MMVMMVVEENKSNACGLIKIKHKEFTKQNIVMDWRKLATSSTIAFETGIRHKEMLFIKLYFAKILFNPLATKDV